MLKKLELKNKFRGLQFDFIDDLGDEVICYVKFNQNEKNIKLAQKEDSDNYDEGYFLPYIVYDKEQESFNAGYNQYMGEKGVIFETGFTKNEIEYISKKLKKDLEKAIKEN